MIAVINAWKRFLDWLFALIGGWYGVPPDDWERIVSLTWFYATSISVIFGALILLLRYPRTRVQRGSAGIMTSFSMILIRAWWDSSHPGESIAQPWSMVFWFVQFLISVYFIYALFTEWVWPLRKKKNRRIIVRSLFVVMVVIAFLGSSHIAQAQNNPAQCPSGFSCVPFEGATLAFNPDQGFVQYVVVEVRSTSITTFAGESSTNQVVLVAFERQDDDSFVADESYTEDRSGIFANAELGDIFVLTEVR